MNESILVINAGSSSIKFSMFAAAPGRPLEAGVSGQAAGLRTQARFEATDATGRKLLEHALPRNDHRSAIAAIHDWLTRHLGGELRLAGVGHRVVHGGSTYIEPVLIDDTVMAALAALVPFAPLHQPHHLEAIRAVGAIAPHVPQVACFDTAFHACAPALAREFALPRALASKGVRRYGFHGISYEYIASVLPRLAPDCAAGKVVIAHLGNGASLCAIERGRSVATTMGLTPLDGLVMGTRAGALDPGVILYLLQNEGMDADAIAPLLYERSGLLGVSALSSDMRVLLASGRASAKEAVDLFVYRIGRELGSLIAALGGIDGLVFTAGIGEHAPEIRARVCEAASWAGVVFDAGANARGGPRISREGSRVSAWVIPTNENLMIARHTRRLLDRPEAKAQTG